MDVRRFWMQWVVMLGILLVFSHSAAAKEPSSWKVNILPQDKAVGVAVDDVITMTFSGAIQLKNSRDITDKSWLSLVQLVDEKKKKGGFRSRVERFSEKPRDRSCGQSGSGEDVSRPPFGEEAKGCARRAEP